MKQIQQVKVRGQDLFFLEGNSDDEISLVVAFFGPQSLHEILKRDQVFQLWL